jgi:ectoine hydroxylase-related dioxygenase (phytanoyl-CoA dioxygenase family)
MKLHEHYPLTEDQKAFYRKFKYIKLKNVFDSETLAYYGKKISDKVNEMNQQNKPSDARDTYGKAFLQIFNLWREDEIIKEFVMSKRLGQIVSELMEADGARIYHDQALFKEGGGGITPWHADQYYWPLSSDKTVTAWIPLQTIPLEMGPLEFSAGSHAIVEGRELAIGDESEQIIAQKLRVTDFNHVIEPFDLGEVSFHSGWVFHRAGANQTNTMRKVMTVIYMDKDMILKTPENENQQKDWEVWCPGAKIGEIIDTHLNPVVYSK